MKELNTKDIQRISLDILSDLHNFCIEHNIKYSLGYGTLIGAIRHKGFIPWDDDIDIMMPRPDFELFCKSFKSNNNYKLYAPTLNNTYISYGRLCDVEKTKLITHAPWNGDNTGVWIDIFPIDGAPDDFKKQTERFYICKALYSEQLNQRYIMKRWLKNSLKSKLSFIKEYFKGNVRIKEITKKYDSFCKEIPFGSTLHLTKISCLNDNINLYYNIEDFKSYILVTFENKEFYIATGYDHILRSHYDDYMKLPPIEKQKTNHNYLHKFYWK